MKHQLNGILSSATALLLIFWSCATTTAASAQGAATSTAQAAPENSLVKRGYNQLFIFDPGNSGTVAASYTTKFSRIAALLVQPHSVKNTACGALYLGLTGLPISNLILGVDLSTDTVVTNKAVFVLVGVDRNGNVITHSTTSENFFEKVSSAPGWITYKYSAQVFSPPIGSTEVLSSLALSLLGGTADHPDHDDHWASHLTVNGRFVATPMLPTANVSGGTPPVMP
jgi:hypothetical protein